MPETRTTALARRDRLEGKSPSTQAGEFVREEIRHIRQGKHGARSTSQAIAIGLSQARRAGVKLPAPAGGQACSASDAMRRRISRSEETRPRTQFRRPALARPCAHCGGKTALPPPAARWRSKRGGVPVEKARPGVRPSRARRHKRAHAFTRKRQNHES